jgi:catechol 2,3-dioxygenase-like lactoylglutathione lyase family enzyme
VEERPPVWIGHAVLTVSDVGRSARWWHDIGMREIEGGDAPFDLMVENLDATHQDWSARGIAVGPITRGRIHNAFEATDPDGYRVTVNSTHVIGPV